MLASRSIATARATWLPVRPLLVVSESEWANVVLDRHTGNLDVLGGQDGDGILRC
jgi:hypothetical protein